MGLKRGSERESKELSVPSTTLTFCLWKNVVKNLKAKPKKIENNLNTYRIYIQQTRNEHRINGIHKKT